eukprot:1720106-Amphidinium_carterae.1
MAFITCHHWFWKVAWVKVHGQIQVPIAASFPFRIRDGLAVGHSGVVLACFEAVSRKGPAVRALLPALLEDPTSLCNSA